MTEARMTELTNEVLKEVGSDYRVFTWQVRNNAGVWAILFMGSNPQRNPIRIVLHLPSAFDILPNLQNKCLLM